jgi:iron complex outermembrane receptor protein
MNKILPLFAALLFAVTVSAQEISGILLDNQSGEPLISATVLEKGTQNGALTDVDGKFTLKLSQPLPLTLTFSYIGYTSQEIELKTATDLKRSFTIKLVSNEVQLKGVEIVDTRVTEKQQQNPLTVESMGLQAIKAAPTASFYEGLGAQKGVDMTSASLGFVIINTRGFNSTSPVRSLQLLDGADNQAPGLNFSIGNFAGATEIDIQKVDLIVGASSPLYGPNAFNGVISMQTKNPFYHNGLSVQVKGGERQMFEGAIRYARVFKNKNDRDIFAFKVNFSYLRAYDWVANNLAPSTASGQDENNPGGYDAVNRYGDELPFNQAFNYDDRLGNRNQPGLKQFYRTGYMEEDVVDYNVRNIKANAALHYKITDKIEARVAYNFGYGTTVYQGDNRYSLKDLQFHQIRAEVIQPDKFYIRAYTTMENAGNSYDAVFTALKLQDLTKDNSVWGQHYAQAWNNYIGKVRALPGYPDPTNPAYTSLWFTSYDSINNVANSVLAQYSDSINLWHSLSRLYADTFTFGGLYPQRPEPGTPQFDSLLKVITARTAFEEGGTKFFDRSKMMHVQGEYKFEPKLKGQDRPFMDIIAGASFRMYFPDSRGTVFSDTVTREYLRDSLGEYVKDGNNQLVAIDSTRNVIRNWEVGAYLSVVKKLKLDTESKHEMIFTATVRVDKNQNFPFIATPAASIVYSYKKNHTFRVSFSSAIRNPTLQDQYLYYNVGRATLIGNLKGVDSLVTVDSYVDYLNSNPFKDSLLSWFSVPAVKPEKVRSLEIGYKGIWFNKVYFDASAYVSFYKDFLGYQIGARITNPDSTTYRLQRVYRVAANSPDRIMTYGVSAGFNYFFYKNYALTGNYSWNKLNKLGSTDPIIPAFNTPEHKFNLGINGKDIAIGKVKGFGFNINYKWIQGFVFEGSPQFTGEIPTYSLLDAQVSWEFKKIFTTFKFGGSNLISKKNFQTYGGPGIGRMLYGTITFDIGQDVLEKKRGSKMPAETPVLE